MRLVGVSDRRVVLGSRSSAIVLVLVLAAFVGVIAGPALPARAASPLDVAHLRFEYGSGFAAPSGYWVGTVTGGEWAVTGSRFHRNGRLTLSLEIRPPQPSLPLDPGPAVLFASLMLSGGYGGDVGAEVASGPIVHQRVDACPDPADCVYRTRITLRTDTLAATARRNPVPGWSGAVVALTFVRTYGQGTWLQILPLYDEELELPTGTVGHPIPVRSRMEALGAFTPQQGRRWLSGSAGSADRIFSIIERERRSGVDPSVAAPVTSALLDLDPSDCRQGWTLSTATGDVGYDVTDASHGRIRLALPVGSSWVLYVPSLDHVDSASDAQAFGPFTFTDTQPARLTGRWACDGSPGGVTLARRVSLGGPRWSDAGRCPTEDGFEATNKALGPRACAS